MVKLADYNGTDIVKSFVEKSQVKGHVRKTKTGIVQVKQHSRQNGSDIKTSEKKTVVPRSMDDVHKLMRTLKIPGSTSSTYTKGLYNVTINKDAKSNNLMTGLRDLGWEIVQRRASSVKGKDVIEIQVPKRK